LHKEHKEDFVNFVVPCVLRDLTMLNSVTFRGSVRRNR